MRISDWSSDVCSSRSLTDRLDIFLRDEIVDRLNAAARNRVRDDLGRLCFGLGRTLAGFRVAENGFAAALGLEDLRLLLALGAQDRAGARTDRKSTRLNSSH